MFKHAPTKHHLCGLCGLRALCVTTGSVLSQAMRRNFNGARLDFPDHIINILAPSLSQYHV